MSTEKFPRREPISFDLELDTDLRSVSKTEAIVLVQRDILSK